MSGFFSTVANAALPVAVGLLVLAVVARGVLLTQPDDARAIRLADLYVEPLAVWSLAALTLQVLALVAAGRAGALALSLPIALALVAAAVLLWSESESEPAAEEGPVDAPAPAAAPARMAGGPLWARPWSD
jgi:hypothetical protein